jgi:signal transduction histidine kinase
MVLEDIYLGFPQGYQQAALMVSLLSVWMLVGLFYYLNRYTKREYFTIWTAAWLFYALWLTVGLRLANAPPGSTVFMLKQCSAAISAVFLLWGSLRFLNISVRQSLLGLFMLFLVVWNFVSPRVISNTLQLELPVFILLGCASMFAGVCFHRLRKKIPIVGSGMLSAGFLLWGVYLATYPISQKYQDLYSAGFFVAAVLQLFISVSMIVLVLEEVRYTNEKMVAELVAIRSEKEALQVKFLGTEERCRNLYDQAQLADAVQKAYDQLRHSQQGVVQQERLRALGQMASGIAHDINNALLPIVAYSELLATTLPNLSESSRHQFGHISKAAEDIGHIVAGMQEFYRRRADAEELKPVNIDQIIEEVVELTRPRWRDLPQRHGISIHIEREEAPAPPLLLSDASELREMFTNLIFNAVDALPRGGTITFVTRTVDRPAPEEDAPPMQHLEVEVRDNGIGMDEKTRQRCLEPFFSTKAQRGGCGLGMAMVYGVMQRHEGRIEIVSSPGRGTCVKLTFPIRTVTPCPAPAGTPPVGASRPIRILCIDDEPAVRETLNDCLKNFNYNVTLVEDGKSGVEQFRTAKQERDPYDVVITDLGMPDMDGHQVVRTIKAESPNTPVIMMTGWKTIMKEDGEIAPEVDAAVGKPLRIQELNLLILRLTAPISAGLDTFTFDLVAPTNHSSDLGTIPATVLR